MAMEHVIENEICNKMMCHMSIDGHGKENDLKGKDELKFHKIAFFAHFPIHFIVDMVSNQHGFSVCLQYLPP